MSVQDWTCSVCGIAHRNTACGGAAGVSNLPSNPYCEKHEWPAGMGKECPDCAELGAKNLEIKLLHTAIDKSNEALEEAVNLKAKADENWKLYQETIFQLNAAKEQRDAALLQIRAAEPVIGAARLMVKHQEDRHELSSCCHDVTPTNAYLLKRALAEWDATQKPEEGLPKNGPVSFRSYGVIPHDFDIAKVWVENTTLHIKMEIDNAFDVVFESAAVLRPRSIIPSEQTAMRQYIWDGGVTRKGDRYSTLTYIREWDGERWITLPPQILAPSGSCPCRMDGEVLIACERHAIKREGRP